MLNLRAKLGTVIRLTHSDSGDPVLIRVERIGSRDLELSFLDPQRRFEIRLEKAGATIADLSTTPKN